MSIVFKAESKAKHEENIFGRDFLQKRAFSGVQNSSFKNSKGGENQWPGVCLRFHPKCRKFGTALHLGPKILGKIKKNWGLKGPFF